jgi:thiosulfate dehydrogenase
MANLEQDYPERERKPVDSPYPPYADPFPVEQHRLGPYGPIRAYYEQQ